MEIAIVVVVVLVVAVVQIRRRGSRLQRAELDRQREPEDQGSSGPDATR